LESKKRISISPTKKYFFKFFFVEKVEFVSFPTFEQS